eukprot:m.146585 g.146585  ORF g.146585 m.146585 type:complete len:61 (-) comp14151_c0_seq1:211-393(-)
MVSSSSQQSSSGTPAWRSPSEASTCEKNARPTPVRTPKQENGLDNCHLMPVISENRGPSP